MKADHFFTEHLEPFGEPRTIPCGWDLAGVEACRPGLSDRAVFGSNGSDGAGRMPEQAAATPDSFMKVRTLPEKWDLSHWLD